MLDRIMYAQIVDACPPEMRQEIKRLDGRTGRAMRRKAQREICNQNIESIANRNVQDTLDNIVEIVRKTSRLNLFENEIVELRAKGYKIHEISYMMNKSIRTIFRSLDKIRKT